MGLPAVYHFPSALDTGGLQYGGIVLTVGYALAVVAEIRELKARPTIRHAG